MTLYIAAINGNSEPFLIKAEDLGAGTADSPAGKVVALHNHDAIFLDAWSSITDYGINKSYYSAAISTSGDNTLVAAPGVGSYISVKWLHIGNESATETTVLIKSGASTQRFRCVLSPKGTAGEHRYIEFPIHSPLNVDTNEALVANLSGPNAIGISAGYIVKS
jgi:hypothetical protein